MTLIIHRCNCGHSDIEHDPQRSERTTSCSFGWCRCRRVRHDVRTEDPVEAIPSWTPSGEPIQTVMQPGSLIVGAPPPTRTCDCGTCIATFEGKATA